MKDFELRLKEDESELIKQQIKRKKIGILKPQRGHSCFELDMLTGNISIINYESINADFRNAISNDNSVHKNIHTKETSLYTTALNKKNAEKKFIKMLLNYATTPTD